MLGVLTRLLFLVTLAGDEFPAQLTGVLAAFTGMLIGSLGPQAIADSRASHHRLAIRGPRAGAPGRGIG